ncbi:MAG: hypothetical protein RI907_2938, partial [Pseudomonadota bacterium]
MGAALAMPLAAGEAPVPGLGGDLQLMDHAGQPYAL